MDPWGQKPDVPQIHLEKLRSASFAIGSESDWSNQSIRSIRGRGGALFGCYRELVGNSGSMLQCGFGSSLCLMGTGIKMWRLRLAASIQLSNTKPEEPHMHSLHVCWMDNKANIHIDDIFLLFIIRCLFLFGVNDCVFFCSLFLLYICFI